MAKRYIITCVSCGLLTEVSRRNAWSCSSRCRVHLHRHRDVLGDLQKRAQTYHVEVFHILEAGAVGRLRPDLQEAVELGMAELHQVREDVARAYDHRLREIITAIGREHVPTAI